MPKETREVNKKSFGRKNLNSTHFKTFVKNHVNEKEVLKFCDQYCQIFGCKSNIWMKP